jgi:hypothetical protein
MSKEFKASEPQLGVSGDGVFAVWNNGYSGDIIFRRSTDSGATFSEEKNLNTNANITDASRPMLDISGKNVFVVWYGTNQEMPGNSDKRFNYIAFVRSIDGGATFGAPKFYVIPLSDTDSHSQPFEHLAEVAASENGNVYLLWHEADGQFFRRSTDRGATFENPINVFAGACTPEAAPPMKLVADGNKVYAICRQEGVESEEGQYGTRGYNKFVIILFAASLV